MVLLLTQQLARAEVRRGLGSVGSGKRLQESVDADVMRRIWLAGQVIPACAA
jgi:hypothetical protein